MALIGGICGLFAVPHTPDPEVDEETDQVDSQDGQDPEQGHSRRVCPLQIDRQVYEQDEPAKTDAWVQNAPGGGRQGGAAYLAGQGGAEGEGQEQQEAGHPEVGGGRGVIYGR